MAVVETTTIRVRRSTQQRLAKEAELAGTSVVEVLEAAVDLLEEQRLLASMDESYRKYGDEIHAEMKDWLEMPLDGLTDAD
jgi:uncharacterized protein (DUF2384 family)